jgi:hypothetical protein
MAEDIIRESGYLSQSENVRDFLQSLLDKSNRRGLSEMAAEKLLKAFNIRRKRT